MILSSEWMVSKVYGTVPLKRGRERMLVFKIKVYFTGSGYHYPFGIRKLKKARRRLSRFSTMVS